MRVRHRGCYAAGTTTAVLIPFTKGVGTATVPPAISIVAYRFWLPRERFLCSRGRKYFRLPSSAGRANGPVPKSGYAGARRAELRWQRRCPLLRRAWRGVATEEGEGWYYGLKRRYTTRTQLSPPQASLAAASRRSTASASQRSRASNHRKIPDGDMGTVREPQIDGILGARIHRLTRVSLHPLPPSLPTGV